MMDISEKVLIIGSSELYGPLAELLGKEGCGIKLLSQDREVFDAFDKFGFDLIIADMPAEDSGRLAILSKLKNNNPFLKIVALIPPDIEDNASYSFEIKNTVDEYLYHPFEAAHVMRFSNILLSVGRIEKEYAAKIVSLKKSFEHKMREKTNELTLLFEIGRELTSSLSLEEVLRTIVDRISEVLGVERCSILLFDNEQANLYIAAAKGIAEEVIKDTRIKPGDGISGWVFQHKNPVMVGDIEADGMFTKKNEERYYTGSFLSVPLIFKGKPIGVINVNNKRSKQIFTEDDLRLIEGIADQAAIAIENARLYKNLQGIYIQIINALTSVIELKDHYTKGHSERVTKYAVALAKELGLDNDKIKVIELACQLHDLGKIGIHEYILTKPGRLTFEEWNEIKLHPTNAVEILKPLTFLSEVIEMVEQHHERYDGKGYPHGDKAEDIEIGARIMAVADSYDAMTTRRPYATPLTPSDAVKEIQRCSGAQYDPRVVEAFARLFEKNPAFFEKEPQKE